MSQKFMTYSTKLESIWVEQFNSDHELEMSI